MCRDNRSQLSDMIRFNEIFGWCVCWYCWLEKSSKNREKKLSINVYNILNVTFILNIYSK